MARIMKSAALCVLFVTVFSKPAIQNQERVSYREHKLVSVTTNTSLEVEYMRELQSDPDLNLDFWKQPMLGDVHIHVNPKVEKRFFNSLKRAGLTYSVVQEDIQSLIDDEARSMSRNAASLDFTSSYLTFEQVEQKLQDLQKEYPNRIQLLDIGTTDEGRTLWAAKISTHLNGSGKKAVWIEGTAHAREWISTSVSIATIDKLVKEEDLYARQMLLMFDWYVIPVLNPDGYVYSHTNERLWRKNRKKNSGRCDGVDLNRNWDVDFGGEGTSSNQCSDVYPGTNARSEKETMALHNAVISTPDVVAFFSIHCYSQLILLPYGYTWTFPQDYDVLLTLSKNAETKLESYYGTQYTVGRPGDVLYLASGGSFDHMKDIIGIKYSYTYELRPGGNTYNGFVLNPNQIAPTIEETFASLWKFADDIYNADK